MRLLHLFRAYRWPIIIALSLAIIENVAWILEPYLFGPVLDALIEIARKEQARAAATLPLFLWIGAFAVNSGVGTLRRSLDPRIYLRVYADIASGVVRAGREQGLAAGVMAARAQLTREFIDFLEYRVPETLEHTIALTGAMIGLAFFDFRIALACALVIAPLLMIRRVYTRRVLGLQKVVHDRMEAAFDIFNDMTPEEVRSYYMETSGPQQRIANWGAASFGLMRVVLLGVFLTVLFVSIDLDNFSIGQIYSIVAYLWTFVTSSEYLPELLASWTSVQDLLGRLRSGSDVGPAA